MTFETFFDKFDQFADAPNVVAKLRELVLKLAFTGKLLRKNSTGSELPEGWAVQSIGAIAHLITPGFACSRNHQVENGHVHLRTHNISTLGTLNFDLLVRVAPQMVDLQRSSIKAGDILFNNTNSQELVGKTCLVDCDYEFGFSNHITRIRLKEGFYPNFVVFYLTLLRNNGYFSRICTRWINQAAVNTDTLKLQKIPLPPLTEQKRIVAKVDELMALCDRLEAQLQARDTQQAALARAALARFADAPTPANLELLFHPAFAVAPADLRKSILTLAVQGKLVEQDSSDGSALQLLSAIEDNINILRQKKEFRGSPIEPLERKNMLRIPINWEWVRLGNIVDYGSSDKYDSSDIPADAWLLDLEDIEKDTSRLLRRKLFQDSPSKSTKTAFRAGDVLYGKLRPYLNKVIVADQPGYFTTEIVPIRAFGYIDSAYLCYALKCPNFIDYANTKSYGMNLPRLGTEDARRAPFPLPPLAEQRRIVAKVDELMALVDQLEAQLATARTRASQLLDAVIAELTAP